ncbi:unnamed protein product, partial [Linum tenue]
SGALPVIKLLESFFNLFKLCMCYIPWAANALKRPGLLHYLHKIWMIAPEVKIFERLW